LNIKQIGYLNQIHSDLVYIHDGKIHDGDAIITNEKQVAIGVFYGRLCTGYYL
jgi:copper oxidase (laccase) domain-containing protein